MPGATPAVAVVATGYAEAVEATETRLGAFSPTAAYFLLVETPSIEGSCSLALLPNVDLEEVYDDDDIVSGCEVERELESLCVAGDWDGGDIEEGDVAEEAEAKYLVKKRLVTGGRLEEQGRRGWGEGLGQFVEGGIEEEEDMEDDEDCGNISEEG